MEGDFFVSAVGNLSPKYLYEGAGVLAYWVAGALTVPLLFFSLVKRTGGEIFSTFSGNNVQWVKVLGSFMGWTILLTMYFSFCQVIFDSFNVLYRFSDALGGEGATLRKFNEYYDLALSYTEDRDIVDRVMDAASMPVTGASLIFYKLSLLVYLAADNFIKWAQAIGFATAFYWGLIAIPYSLNSEQDSNFIKYWKVMFTTSLLWPVIHGFTQWLVSQGFIDMFDAMAPMFGKGKTPMIDLASVYNTFTLLHFVLFLTQGLALALVVGLVATGSVSALNNMAMGGALAVGALAYSSLSKGMGKLNRDNLRTAGQGVEKMLEGGGNLAKSGANALGSFVDRINPKPNNGYSFASNSPSVGGNVGGNSGFQLGGSEQASQSNKLDQYVAMSEPMAGGAKPASGYGSLGKGKVNAEQYTNSDISNKVDFKAPAKKLAGGSEKVSGYGSIAKPKEGDTNTNKNTAQIDRSSEKPKSNKLDQYVAMSEPMEGGAKPASGYGSLGKGKGTSTSNQSNAGESVAGKGEIAGSGKKLSGGSKPTSGYTTTKPIVESKANKSASATAKTKPIMPMTKANMASKAQKNVRASGQAEGADKEQPPKKRNLTEQQKKARKAVFVRKAQEKNKGD